MNITRFLEITKKNIADFLLLTTLIIASFNMGFCVELVTPKLNPPLPLPEFPIIDGSSSTVAMHAAIQVRIKDEYFLPTHSKTYAALWRLAPKREKILVLDGKAYARLDNASEDRTRTTQLEDGSWVRAIEYLKNMTESTFYSQADMLLSVKYYDSALLEAEKFGADLVVTPVAKEGFVFMVHESNPVNTLTSEEIKGIFSGKITNWKEVGGNDEPILTYQRNADSGSQTAMVDFMDGVPLTASDFYPVIVSSMSGIISDIRERKNTIGYNIYSWSLRETLESLITYVDDPALQIMSGQNLYKGIKFIAVDGVMPSDETLADDTYPLRIYTYSYYNKGNEKGKALTD